MPKKTEFHTVEFFRRVRDQQAAALSGKSAAEIIAFFSGAKKTKPTQAKVSRRRDMRAS